MKIIKVLLQILIPVALVAGGFAGMKMMIAARHSPQKETRPQRGALVEVIEAARENRTVEVKGTGTVMTHREVSLTPQVSGRVTAVTPGFVAGGFFHAGDLLFEIERIDYELALETARAARARAELDLARQEGSALVAKQEWERLSGKSGEKPNPLVLYAPQLKQAKAALAAADTAIRKAELDLERTRVYAPFNCRVRQEQVDVGQYVRAGVSYGVVADSDTAEIVVPLALGEMSRLRIPRAGGETKGSAVQVELNVGGRTHRWRGDVVRSLGEVDPKGRMTQVVAVVENPYHLSRAREAGRPDLEVGLFVDVIFEGGALKDVFPIPRSALRENSSVWVATGNDTLTIRPVTVVRREDGTVLVGDGLDEGDRIIVTMIPGAAEGMKLRLAEEGAAE